MAANPSSKDLKDPKDKDKKKIPDTSQSVQPDLPSSASVASSATADKPLAQLTWLDSLPELVAAEKRGAVFDSPQARAFSCYAGICQPQKCDQIHSKKTLYVISSNQLWPTKNDSTIAPQGEAAHDMLRAFVLGEYYPCLGAHAAFSHGTYRFGFYKTLAHLGSVAAMGRDLRRFVQEYEQIGDFTTFIAVFKHPQTPNENEFEKLLWEHLQLLHDHDIDAWDSLYSPDPKSKDFAFSFYGKAFFVLGMNPSGSRFSRRFPFCTLTFNPESQIQRLMQEGELDRFAKAIRQRDILFQGSINPSLQTATNTSGGETQVYSGKTHLPGDGWVCPFNPRPEILAKYSKQ